jgi:hypothetical protein
MLEGIKQTGKKRHRSADPRNNLVQVGISGGAPWHEPGRIEDTIELQRVFQPYLIQNTPMNVDNAEHPAIQLLNRPGWKICHVKVCPD